MANVLIVDDDPDICILIAKYVEHEGHTPITATNTAEALELLSSDPALVFLDIDMPGETGVALVLRLRAQKTHITTPFVFVTAYLETCATMRNADLTAVEVITKPFRREDITQTIQKYCAT